MISFIIIILLVLLCVYKLNQHLRSITITHFKDKHVVITGCDSGFGKELALRLDSMGFRVFAGCLTQEGRDSLSASASEKLMTVSLDVTDPGSVNQIYDFVNQNLTEGGLWALVNNAGISGLEAPVEMCSITDFEAALKVNLLGPIQMSKKFLPLLRKSRGRLINMTSVAGRIAAITAPYTVSKFAFEALSDCLRRELYEQGVRVCIIEPGFHKTAILNTEAVMKRVQLAYDKSSEEVQSAYGQDFLHKLRRQYSTIVSNAAASRSPVVDAYVQAITARFPKTRYLIGVDAKYIAVPATLLPDEVVDFGMNIWKNIMAAK